ncbi:MAG: hypothetical protein HYT12_03005 [Candidatus Liptonbacteria bacterium]|nr:hypothetical protein [Candidatus Liptonbacteria bacterium]
MAVGETPSGASVAAEKNLRTARRLIGKPVCGNCMGKLMRRPGGDLITFRFSR